MTQIESKTIPCIVAYGENYPILEVWESYSGWYWFITQYDKDDLDIAYGYVVGFENEWGNISLAELRELEYTGKVWTVPKKNWFSISHVTMIPVEEIK